MPWRKDGGGLLGIRVPDALFRVTLRYRDRRVTRMDGPLAIGPASRAVSPTVGGYRYKAFISYRHHPVDRRWATWIESRLEAFRVPKRLQRERGLPARLGRCFRDEDELATSADLSRDIRHALKESEFLIVVCSPRTPGSEWVNKEIDYFRKLGRGERVLGLLIEGGPYQSFPPALTENRGLVVPVKESLVPRQRAEPLAADVRPSATDRNGHVRRMGLQRLVATLLGVKFDELRQREQERRTRRTALAGSVLTA